MMLLQDETTIISKLCVTTSEMDRPQVRLHLSNLLEMVTFRPASLAPSAIVCIRQLHDPLPQKLSLRSSRPNPDWQQAVRNRIDTLVRQAARPASGTISSMAPAVIFRDQSEMMACFANDWMSGSVLNRWWWRALIHNHSVRDAVFKLWTESLEHVPTALHTLSKIGDVTRFVRALTNLEILTLTDGVIQTYQLNDLRHVLTDPISAEEIEIISMSQYQLNTSATEVKNQVSLPDDSTNQHELKSPVKISDAIPVWHSTAPEANTFSPDHPGHLLLGVGLSIVRAPTQIRTLAFAQQTRRWVAAVQYAQMKNHASPNKPTQATPSAQLLDEPTAPNFDSIQTNTDQPQRDHEETPQARAQDNIDDSTYSEQNKNESRPTSKPKQHVNAYTNPLDSFQMEQPYVYGEDAQVLHTRLGGIFYLLNVGLYLDLYGDMTQPNADNFALSIWNFLAYVAVELLEGRRADDGIWELFAGLTSRDITDRADKDFVPLSNWQMPPKWLTSIPDAGEWKISQQAQHLQIWHPLGFCVVDSDELRLEDCLASYDIKAYTTTDITRQSYLTYLTRYIETRLRFALDQPEDLAIFLFVHDARIYLTLSHLDVVYQLDELPIEIRMAGLDRDPGWIPAAGKIIRFHFE